MIAVNSEGEEGMSVFDFDFEDMPRMRRSKVGTQKKKENQMIMIGWTRRRNGLDDDLGNHQSATMTI